MPTTVTKMKIFLCETGPTSNAVAFWLIHNQMFSKKKKFIRAQYYQRLNATIFESVNSDKRDFDHTDHGPFFFAILR
jgi:hypothetical protein